MENESQGAKTSKTAAVKSLLSRVTSKGEPINNDLGIPQPSSGARLSTERNRDVTMPRASMENSRGMDSSMPRLSTEPSRDSTTSNVPTPLVQGTTPVSTGVIGPQSSSVESSVKVFRVYEVLRGGDPAAVQKIVNEASSGQDAGLQGTTILHLAIQCADQTVIEQILSSAPKDLNTRELKDGNTPLIIAAVMNRPLVVKLLLQQRGVDDSLTNYQGKSALDMAKAPEVFEQLQMARSLYIDQQVKKCHRLVQSKNYGQLENLCSDDHFKSAVDINSGEMATDPAITANGGTLLHQAASYRDHKLIELLLMNGADPFRRDRKGKLPQDVTEDKTTRALLKKSPAATAAQRGIQERTILGANAGQQVRALTGENALGGKEGREMKGYLKKWVNYTTGYKLRWFVLEDGVLSYYKHQDDAGSACRGAVNMKIASLHMDGTDNARFEIIGKSSVKYHLKANHEVEAKRWFWALTNAIQHAKDDAKAATRAQNHQADLLRQAQVNQAERKGSRSPTKASFDRSYNTRASMDNPRASMESLDRGRNMGNAIGDDDAHFSAGTTAIGGDPDEDDAYGDDASSIDGTPVTKDAFMIAAHSARLQLDLLTQMSSAMQAEKNRNPSITLSDPTVSQALSSYESSVLNLKGLISDLGRIARDRESYWHSRLEQEVNVRRIWENNMQKVVHEQEELESRFGESEDKRRRTKRALRDALENQSSSIPDESVLSPGPELQAAPRFPTTQRARTTSIRRKSTFAEMNEIAGSESDDEDDEEFFDAVTAGDVEVYDELPEQQVTSATVPVAQAPPLAAEQPIQAPEVRSKAVSSLQRPDDMSTSFKGYEDPVRTKLKLAADDRPKVSLWGILKGMIGKDMSKMTLPVSFNEPTSLLQRVCEDMQYAELLDTAVSRANSAERMVYVAAFAASEYASTIGRVAKPFNPLLGETYEYARPDKGYRFFIEQVSHHPPIGAAWANAVSWDYYGESAVRSKFYGKSFDINPLGTWFLRLRPTNGGPEELYTWKKITSSVIGIITGSPSVDNYGLMEITNHTTKDVCVLDFKQRGWKASSAYGVSGKVVSGADGKTCWSIGGKSDSRLYARHTPGYVDELEASGKQAKDANPEKAFLVWEAHARPTGIPFNLTSFGVTLNALQPKLQPMLPPTDTRLRPDQRSMECGEYDRAATEKERLEEKQRAARRERERNGEEWKPRWFEKSTDAITGEEYWRVKRAGGAEKGEVEYWRKRGEGDWSGCDDIF